MSTHKDVQLPACPPSPPATGSGWDKYVQLVAGMATDMMLGMGPTPEAFVNNLRLIADQMEDLLPNTAGQWRREKDEKHET